MPTIFPQVSIRNRLQCSGLCAIDRFMIMSFRNGFRPSFGTLCHKILEAASPRVLSADAYRSPVPLEHSLPMLEPHDTAGAVTPEEGVEKRQVRNCGLMSLDV